MQISYSATMHAHDFELKAEFVKAQDVTNVGHPTEAAEDTARNGAIVTWGKCHTKGFFDPGDVDTPVSTHRAFIDDLHNGLWLIELVFDLANDLFEDVFERDHTGHTTVFVNNDCQMHIAGLQIDEQVCDALGLGHYRGSAKPQIDVAVGAAVEMGTNQVLNVYGADDVVDVRISTRHRDTAESVQCRNLQRVADGKA